MVSRIKSEKFGYRLIYTWAGVAGEPVPNAAIALWVPEKGPIQMVEATLDSP
jgi:hypothetical protein